MSTTTDSESEWSKLDDSDSLTGDNQVEVELTEAPTEASHDDVEIEIVEHVGREEQEQEVIGSEIRKLVLKSISQIPHIKIVDSATAFSCPGVVFTYKTEGLKNSIQIFRDLTNLPLEQRSDEAVAHQLVLMGDELAYEDALNIWIYESLMSDFHSIAIEKIDLGAEYGTAIKVPPLEISLNDVQKFLNQLAERVRTIESAVYYRTKFLEINPDDFPMLMFAHARDEASVGVVWYIPVCARETDLTKLSWEQTQEISRLNRKLFDELKAHDSGITCDDKYAERDTTAYLEFGLDSKVEDLVSFLNTMAKRGQELEDAPQDYLGSIWEFVSQSVADLKSSFSDIVTTKTNVSSMSPNDYPQIPDKMSGNSPIVFMLTALFCFYIGFIMIMETTLAVNIGSVPIRSEWIDFVRENCIEQKLGNTTIDPFCHIKWNLRHEPIEKMEAIVSQERRKMEDISKNATAEIPVWEVCIFAMLLVVLFASAIAVILHMCKMQRKRRSYSKVENENLDKEADQITITESSEMIESLEIENFPMELVGELVIENEKLKKQVEEHKNMAKTAKENADKLMAQMNKTKTELDHEKAEEAYAE